MATFQMRITSHRIFSLRVIINHLKNHTDFHFNLAWLKSFVWYSTNNWSALPICFGGSFFGRRHLIDRETEWPSNEFGWHLLRGNEKFARCFLSFLCVFLSFFPPQPSSLCYHFFFDHPNLNPNFQRPIQNEIKNKRAVTDNKWRTTIHKHGRYGSASTLWFMRVWKINISGNDWASIISYCAFMSFGGLMLFSTCLHCKNTTIICCPC